MRVWLDDERPLPTNFDVLVKTADEAIALLAGGNVTVISLDHDLGDAEEKTGYAVACWIEENAFKGTLKKMRVRCHSQNAVGRQRICMALQNAERYWSR
jgi:hypothetical protein